MASCGVFLSQGKYRSASRARVVFSVNMIQPVESEEWQELSPQQTCQCFLSVPQIRVHSHWTFPHWHRCNYAQVQMCGQGMQALSFSHKCFQSFSKVKLEPAMRVSEHIRPTANLEAVESAPREDLEPKLFDSSISALGSRQEKPFWTLCTLNTKECTAMLS